MWGFSLVRFLLVLLEHCKRR